MTIDNDYVRRSNDGDNSSDKWLDATFQGTHDTGTYSRNGAGMNTQETVVSGATTLNYYNTYDALGRVSAQGTSANPTHPSSIRTTRRETSPA